MHYISPVNITKGKIAHYSFKYSYLLLCIFCFANTNYTQFHSKLFCFIQLNSYYIAHLYANKHHPFIYIYLVKQMFYECPKVTLKSIQAA